MNTKLFSYSVAAEIENIDGNEWPDRENWLEDCPYCESRLLDGGQFHQDTHGIEPYPGAEDGMGLCLECGSKHARYDGLRSRTFDSGHVGYRPLVASPAVSCLVQTRSCPSCGWWYVAEATHESLGWRIPIYHGILHEFDVEAADTPVKILRHELGRNLEKLGNVHPNRFEDLVSEILKGSYECEVVQLGYSRDGGIDLLILDSDTPVAVQIKRRSNLQSAESVAPIREFLGATLLAGHRRLLFVSTARKYSADAANAAQKAIKRGLVDSFRLMGRTELEDFLTRHTTNDIWQDAIRRVANRELGMPFTADPVKFSSHS